MVGLDTADGHVCELHGGHLCTGAQGTGDFTMHGAQRVRPRRVGTWNRGTWPTYGWEGQPAGPEVGAM